MTFVSKLRYGLSAAVCLLSPLFSAAQGQNPTYVSFLVPGSIGTYPTSINNSMTVTGYYVTSSGATHGFVRTPDGVITSFDAPGSTFTEPLSINDSGQIAGTFEISGGIILAFVRNANGTFTTVGNTVPSSFAPQAVKINAAGEIVGNYPGPGAAPFSFAITAAGVLSRYSLSQGADFPTVTTGLNNSGAVVGYWSNYTVEEAEGFVSPPGGVVQSPTGQTNTTPIVALGSYGTFPTGINAGGTVVGCYAINENAGTSGQPVLTFWDFMYAPNGTLTTLGVQGPIPSCVATNLYPGTNLQEQIYGIVPATVNINDSGTIVAAYTTPANVQSGWIRTSSGVITTFTEPNGTATTPTAIDNGNDIAGYFTKGSNVLGFIRVAPTSDSPVVLTVEDPQGFFWDGGNIQWGGTILQIYQDYPSTGQNWTWTPVPGGFTVCDLGICLSDNGSQVVMSTKADVFTITNASAVIDLTTGRYVENAAKPGNGVYLSTGATASPWNFSLTLH